MSSLRKIAFDLLVIAAIAGTGVYIYHVYGEDIRAFFFEEQNPVIFIDNLAVSVTIADDAEERRQGLSGVTSLGELEGKLFIFDAAGYHSMWMKDMNIPLDIIFINDEFRIVDIAENVVPETYPLTFTSSEPARFVLEVNAFFADSFKVEEGSYVTIPPRVLPRDLREKLRGE